MSWGLIKLYWIKWNWILLEYDCMIALCWLYDYRLHRIVNIMRTVENYCKWICGKCQNSLRKCKKLSTVILKSAHYWTETTTSDNAGDKTRWETKPFPFCLCLLLQNHVNHSTNNCLAGRQVVFHTVGLRLINCDKRPPPPPPVSTGINPGRDLLLPMHSCFSPFPWLPLPKKAFMLQRMLLVWSSCLFVLWPSNGGESRKGFIDCCGVSGPKPRW